MLFQMETACPALALHHRYPQGSEGLRNSTGIPYYWVFKIKKIQLILAVPVYDEV